MHRALNPAFCILLFAALMVAVPSFVYAQEEPVQVQMEAPVADMQPVNFRDEIKKELDAEVGGELAADVAPEHIEGETAFPQLDHTTYAGQVFWLAVFFAVLYKLMSTLALPRVASVLDIRAREREGNLSRAEQLRDETDRVRDAYEKALAKAHAEAQDLLAKMSATNSDLAAKRQNEFLADAHKRIETADNNIRKAKNDALQSVSDIAADIVVEAAGKLASLSLNKAQAAKYVSDAMKGAA